MPRHAWRACLDAPACNFWINLLHAIDVYPHTKRSSSYRNSFLRYCWFIVLKYTLSMPGYAWPHPLENYKSIYCFYGCLSTWKKSNSLLNSFLRYLSLKNTVIQLVKMILGHAWAYWPHLLEKTKSNYSLYGCLPTCEKIIFIPQFVFKILGFKESWNLIGWECLGPNSITRFFPKHAVFAES